MTAYRVVGTGIQQRAIEKALSRSLRGPELG